MSTSSTIRRIRRIGWATGINSSVLNVVNIANCGSGAPRIPTVFSIRPQNASTYRENFRTLLTATLPTSTIEVMERIVEIAGNNLGDIRTSHAANSRDLTAILLRLYRQGHEQLRVRCLDVIDRMAELGALGLNEVLEHER